MNSDVVRKAARKAVTEYLSDRKRYGASIACKPEDVKILASAHSSDWVYLLSVQTSYGVRYFMYELGSDRDVGKLTVFSKSAVKECDLF